MSASFQSNCLVDYLCTMVNIGMLNPNSQNTYTPSDICNLMDHQMSAGVVPALKASCENYFVMNVDVPIVQGQSAYTFPKRSVGNALRDVVLLDASGNEVALNNLEREYIKVQFPFNFVPSIWSFGQYVTANEINLYNTLIQSYTAYTLRFIVERRPGALTLSSNCGQINTIVGNVLTLSYVDPSWTTATTFDIINNYAPFQSMGDDLTVTLIAGSQITLSSVPTGLTKGMWVCPAQMSCIPQIPYEFFPLLTEMTTAKVSGGLDMSQLLAASKAQIELWGSNMSKLMRPRVKGSPKVIINKDAFSRGFGGAGGGFR